jgi:hypothetical protein
MGKRFLVYSKGFKPAVQFSRLLSLSIGRDFIWQMVTKNLSVGGFIYQVVSIITMMKRGLRSIRFVKSSRDRNNSV